MSQPDAHQMLSWYVLSLQQHACTHVLPHPKGAFASKAVMHKGNCEGLLSMAWQTAADCNNGLYTIGCCGYFLSTHSSTPPCPYWTFCLSNTTLLSFQQKVSSCIYPALPSYGPLSYAYYNNSLHLLHTPLPVHSHRCQSIRCQPLCTRQRAQM